MQINSISMRLGLRCESNVDFNLGVGWVGGAVVIDFVVGEEGSFAA